MTSITFPLNEIQVALLKLTEGLKEQELQDLKKIIIAYKAQRLSMLADKVWEEKGWTEADMQGFLKKHLRTGYSINKNK